MTEFPAPRRVLHGCLRSVSDPDHRGEGIPLGRARLSDQERLAVVFQGAALLAHLEHGGFFLGEGRAETAWQGAELDGNGRLLVGEVRPGQAADLPQEILRRLLLLVFQTEQTIAGRGTARRIARRLLELWHHRLTPISTDAAVSELLDTAEYLWTPAFAEARKALVAEHVRADGRHPWVVGPGRARRRFLRRAEEAGRADRGTLEALAASDEARDLWEGFDDPDGDPWAYLAEGRFEHAAALWRRRSRRSKAETLAYARALRSAGKASQALAVVKRRRDPEGLLLQAGCRLDLEERQAAERTVHRLDETELDDGLLVALGEIRVRLAAGRYQHSTLREWIAKLLAVESEPARTEALLVAAGAAYDAGDLVAMGRYLDQAAAGGEPEEPRIAVQLHQLEGLRRRHAGDGPGAVEHLTRALSHRRSLPKMTAARLWNDLAVAREAAGDLEGAEHACRHSLRLFAGCEGRSQNSLGLYNLAELRVRRGRLRGVTDILERSTTDNRLNANKRGLAYDLELWARYELALGRPIAALARCTEARRAGEVCNQDALDVLAARAHGWLGERDRAASCLRRAEIDADQMLDPVERPAVWALAGLFDEACGRAEGTEWQELWTSLAAGLHPPSEVWTRLDHGDAFHAARLVFDVERLRPGTVPPERLRRALELFRRRELTGFLEALEQRAASPWKALAAFASAPRRSLEEIRRLFRDAGYDDARLVLRHDGREIALVEGDEPDPQGRPRRLRAESDAGTLTLETTSETGARSASESVGAGDPILEALFAVVRRELDARSEALEPTDLGLDDPAPTDPEEESSRRRSQSPESHGILGESPALRAALSKIDRLARGDLPVLVLGESGTGKELAARRVHRLSLRVSGPFYPLNCAAISESLIQSTLFGHVRGAFTGADQNRKGVFESARGGTVFLDEIGDLPPGTQGNLLRVLQEGEIRRVGDSLARKVDVRIVAATHRDLAAMVEEGTFRRDLYFRLKVAQVELPPLRDRGRDLLLLADHFALRERGTRIGPAARKILRGHDWPGNIRELESVVRVAATYAEFDRIRPEHLADAGLSIDSADEKAVESAEAETRGIFHNLVEDYRKQLVSGALAETGNNQSAAARRLGMTRQSLSYLARKFGLL